MNTQPAQSPIGALLKLLRQPSVTTQPPTSFEMGRNNVAVLVVVLAAFALGFSVRNWVLNASHRFALGDDLPTIRYPADRITSQTESLRFRAKNPASPSSFDAGVDVFVRDLKSEETLDLARGARGIQRSRELEHYRELAADPVTVLDGQPALLTRYAYVADPARASGSNGLPVVVEGQDLLFFHGDKLLVITLAADAHDWETEEQDFQLVFDSLNLQRIDAESVEPTPTEGGKE